MKATLFTIVLITKLDRCNMKQLCAQFILLNTRKIIVSIFVAIIIDYCTELFGIICGSTCRYHIALPDLKIYMGCLSMTRRIFLQESSMYFNTIWIVSLKLFVTWIQGTSPLLFPGSLKLYLKLSNRHKSHNSVTIRHRFLAEKWIILCNSVASLCGKRAWILIIHMKANLSLKSFISFLHRLHTTTYIYVIHKCDITDVDNQCHSYNIYKQNSNWRTIALFNASWLYMNTRLQCDVIKVLTVTKFILGPC